MKILVTYSFENEEGMYDSDYQWYKSEEEMNEDIKFKKEYTHDFEIKDAIEILNFREM